MKKLAILFITISLFFFACENPFADNKISGAQNSIHGSVFLPNGEPAPKVYVWLEQLDIGSFTNSKGEYTISLPPKSSMSTNGAIEGTVDLHYYSINFKHIMKEAFVKDGEFLYNKADVQGGGKVSDVELVKIFDVDILLTSTLIEENETKSPLSIELTFSAITNSFDLINPGGSMDLWGHVFIQNVETGEVTISEYNFGTFYQETIKTKPKVFGHHPKIYKQHTSRVFEILLPSGTYNVIPHVYTYKENVKPAMFSSMGLTLYEPNEKYLDILFEKDESLFTVALEPGE